MSDPSAVPDDDPFGADDVEDIKELLLESVDDFDGGFERVSVGDVAGTAQLWRYGHVIVDEAQDLTPMQWRMVMRRVRGRSMTIVGDLAQAADGAESSWPERLPGSLGDVDQLDLTINYRSPSEIHELAEHVVAEVGIEVGGSRAIRSSGHQPSFVKAGSLDELASLLDRELAAMADQVPGQIAVIGTGSDLEDLRARQSCESGPVEDRVRWLMPGESKGLEFDAVLLVEPASILAGRGGAALLYVALTRPTQRLVVLHQNPLPAALNQRRGRPDRQTA